MTGGHAEEPVVPVSDLFSNSTLIGDSSCPSLGKSVSDVFGLIVLGATTIYLAYRNYRFRGFNGKESNFCGHHEESMLSLFVNFIAAISYFARVVANGACEPGFPIFTTIKFFDYLIVCPLLILDLLWNLESPYKFTCSGLMLVSIVHGVAAYNAEPPESYVWFGAGCVVFSFAYAGIIYLVRERLKHFNNCAVDDQSVEAVFFLKFACGCFFFVWIWYPLVFILSPEGTGVLTYDGQDICHMVLDCLAKSLYGMVSLSFRSRFNKSVLRTIDEEEYVEFSKRYPKRRAITMKISVGGSAADNGDPAFKIQLNDDGDGQSTMDPSDRVSMGVSRQSVKSNRLVQPHDVSRKSVQSEFGGKSASRLYFPSNQQGETYESPKLSFQSIRLEGKEFGQTSEIPMQCDDVQEKWIADLAKYMEEQGLNKNGIIQDTIGKLRKAGISEPHLKSYCSEGELKDIGIPLGARKAILSRFASSGCASPRPRSPDPFGGSMRKSEDRWLSVLREYLEQEGLNKIGLVEDTLSKLRRAGITESHLLDDDGASEGELKALGMPMGARKALLRRYPPLGCGGGGGGDAPAERRSPVIRSLSRPPPMESGALYS